MQHLPGPNQNIFKRSDTPWVKGQGDDNVQCHNKHRRARLQPLPHDNLPDGFGDWHKQLFLIVACPVATPLLFWLKALPWGGQICDRNPTETVTPMELRFLSSFCRNQGWCQPLRGEMRWNLVVLLVFLAVPGRAALELGCAFCALHALACHLAAGHWDWVVKPNQGLLCAGWLCVTPTHSKHSLCVCTHTSVLWTTTGVATTTWVSCLAPCPMSSLARVVPKPRTN